MDDSDDKKTELDPDMYKRALYLTGGVAFWIMLISVNIGQDTFKKWVDFQVVNVTQELIPSEESGEIDPATIQSNFLFFFNVCFFATIVEIFQKLGLCYVGAYMSR